MTRAPAFYRLLGDDQRLRILRLLGRERLNVSELTAILGIAQPGVSRHLRLLREAGLVNEERSGSWTYYKLGGGPPELERLWRRVRADLEVEHDPEDDARLEELRRQREEEFSHERGLVPGRSWTAWARALGRLLPPLRVADLGCGDGSLALECARWARHVIAVDVSEAALVSARKRAREQGLRNLTFKRGEIERLPLADASVDVALLSHALHHAGEPERALKEAARVLVPGGALLVLDLKAHHEEWMRKLGDRWLGFSESRLQSGLRSAGFRDVTIEIGARKRGDPFQVIVASGRRSPSKTRTP